MNLLFATPEASPFSKSGGLGDVMGALPRTIAALKQGSVCVMLPFYESIKQNPEIQAEYVCHFYMPLAWRQLYVGIFKTTLPLPNGAILTYYFVDNAYYFGREGYGYDDDGERFAFFSKAVLESLPHIGFMPDIIHANDWQTGFIPLFYKAFYQHIPAYSHIRTVFTIHNVEYQGKADPSFLSYVLGVDASFRNVVTFDNLVNALKTGIVLCDRLTTVSETYAAELQYDYFAYGLAGIIRENAYKMTGIVNGIDTESYNPYTDKNIPFPFSSRSFGGKKKNKQALKEALGLAPEAEMPLVVLVSRLVAHKGLELIEPVCDALLHAGVQIAVLGTGDARFENLFRALACRHPGFASACITFDETLSRKFYAGADFLLMPSKCEPCGLSQRIAMRYGVIPIVRETGGLVDTVTPIDLASGEGSGITFKTFNAHDMLHAVHRSAELYKNRSLFETIQKKNMEIPADWTQSARKYMELYQSLL